MDKSEFVTKMKETQEKPERDPRETQENPREIHRTKSVRCKTIPRSEDSARNDGRIWRPGTASTEKAAASRRTPS